MDRGRLHRPARGRLCASAIFDEYDSAIPNGPLASVGSAQLSIPDLGDRAVPVGEPQPATGSELNQAISAAVQALADAPILEATWVQTEDGEVTDLTWVSYRNRVDGASGDYIAVEQIPDPDGPYTRVELEVGGAAYHAEYGAGTQGHWEEGPLGPRSAVGPGGSLPRGVTVPTTDTGPPIIDFLLEERDKGTIPADTNQRERDITRRQTSDGGTQWQVEAPFGGGNSGITSGMAPSDELRYWTVDISGQSMRRLWPGRDNRKQPVPAAYSFPSSRATE